MALSNEQAGKPARLASLADRYQRPDLKLTLEQIRRGRLRLRLAMSATSAGKACQDLISCWQDYVQTRKLAGALHEQQSSDPTLLKEMAFFLAADCQVKASLSLALKAIDDCRFRQEILTQIKPFNLESALRWAAVCSERTLPDCETETARILEIEDWLAQNRIFCLGQRWPMSALPALLESPQRSIRRATFRGILDFVRTHEDWLNRQIRELLEIRSQIIKKQRLSRYFEWNQNQIGLIGIQEEQFTVFKQLIQQYFVPMGVEIRRLQRKRLNLDYLSEYDWLCLLPDGHPVPSISRDIQFSTVTRVLTSMLTEGSDLTLDLSILEHPIVDFQLGPDMYGDTKSLLLGPTGPVYWRLPHHGTMADVSHHLQAMGPLLASLADQAAIHNPGSMRPPELPDIARSALQAYLTELTAHPRLAELIQETELYHLLRLTQLTESIIMMTLQADYSMQVHQDLLVDPEQRSKLWLELEQVYLPDLKHDEWPFLADGGLQYLAWEAWLKPGYSLASALGLFAALATWQKSRQSSEHLVQDWTRLILQGNQLSFEQLLSTLSIPLPWDEASFKRLAYSISAELSL